MHVRGDEPIKVVPGEESAFEAVWRNRKTRLDEMAGFVELRYLLLDEPTASLDLAHQIALLKAARAEAAAGAGVLAVLHDLNLAAAFADRVLLIAEGRTVAEGAPEAVFEAGLLSAVYGTAVVVERGRSGSLRIAPDVAPAQADFARGGA